MSLISPAALLFDEVARLGSIRKAAEHLNVSPSALNRRILNLEEDYGLKLFERLPRGVRLTAAGEVLIADIRKWKADQERSKVRLQQLQGLRRGHVSVGLMECLAGDFARTLFDQIQERFRQFTLDIFIGGTALITEKILNSELDLAVCFNVPDRHNIRKLKAIEAPSGVIVAEGHPLAGRASVPLSECIDYPFILPDFSIAARRLIDGALGASGVQTVPSLVTNSTGLMKLLIADNRHIAFLNAGNLIDLRRDAGLVFLPLAGRQLAAEELSLITRTSQGLASATSAVADLIKAQMDSLPIAPKSA
jgi:DNA-binding transcriptional LysR family regulator